MDRKVSDTKFFLEDGSEFPPSISKVTIDPLKRNNDMITAHLEFDMVGLNVECEAGIPEEYLKNLRAALEKFGYELIKKEG